ncbi:hypothetical protein G4Y79_23990 [Phototrophicus methaneseepsis]|uniref:Uncharacterized protein n=1 Tax=Phototrophicus methaneseepsis TaxID=2710758 RepID=A0A7S8IF95_9CHLR|nr:hypothetical protein [Phototrophicus methaneseepsis]QPC82708.1 hypothetical protein G4Y79_23990 [Phototrophicus methaneseepsis]
MFHKRWFLFFLLMIALPIFTVPAQAQGAPLVAFTNSSGQLIVAGADGVTRWIVTNPGETLDSTLGYRWSPDGTRLFYAVDLGNVVSLRVGDAATMTVTELGQANGVVTGGEWAPDGTLLFGTDIALNGARTVAGQVASPYSETSTSLAPDGSAVLYLQGGLYVLQTAAGTAQTLGPSSNNGLHAMWSDIAPIVAFGGQTDSGQANLIAINAANNNAFVLVGSTLPMEPISWVPDSTGLIYRDAGGTIRYADVGCLQSSCSQNMLEAGTAILPPSAQDVHVTTNAVVYRDGEQVLGVPLGCVQNNDCSARTVVMGTQAVQRTGLFSDGQRILYTAYTSDATNPADREIRAIDASCITTNYCQPVSLLNGAIAGRVSGDGLAMVADIVGSGMHIVNLSNLSTLYLTDNTGYALQSARWNS